MGFNRPEAKRLAKAAMRNTNPNPMLVTLVFVLLTTGVSYLVGLVLTNPIYDALYTAYLYLLDGAYDPMFIFKSLLSPGMVAVYMLVSLLLNVYFWVMNFGYASYALRMARGEQPGYRRLFDGFAALGRAILVSLLTSIFLSLWGLLFMVPYMVVMILAALLGSMGLMMLAILLLIGGMVMMVIFSYRYRLATYFLLDHPEMGALESITQSKQAMKGWKGELFILDWSFFGWLLLVAVVELVQAARESEGRRMGLRDMFGSATIEQDADVVMFLYRDDYYNKDTEHPNEAEVIIAKQRNGPIGTIELVWLPRYTQFVNMKK